MTRGKNANKSANREAAMAAREAPLRRQIAALEKQVADLDRANLAQQAVHLETTNRLRVQVAANTGDDLERTRQELTAVIAERDLALNEIDLVQRRWNEISGRVLDLLVLQHGGDHPAAMKEFTSWCGASPDAFLVFEDELIAANKFGAAGVSAIRRARRAAAGGNPVVSFGASR